jgi:hypothetical protein
MIVTGGDHSDNPWPDDDRGRVGLAPVVQAVRDEPAGEAGTARS